MGEPVAVSCCSASSLAMASLFSFFSCTSALSWNLHVQRCQACEACCKLQMIRSHTPLATMLPVAVDLQLCAARGSSHAQSMAAATGLHSGC